MDVYQESTSAEPLDVDGEEIFIRWAPLSYAEAKERAKTYFQQADEKQVRSCEFFPLHGGMVNVLGLSSLRCFFSFSAKVDENESQ